MYTVGTPQTVFEGFGSYGAIDITGAASSANVIALQYALGLPGVADGHWTSGFVTALENRLRPGGLPDVSSVSAVKAALLIALGSTLDEAAAQEVAEAYVAYKASPQARGFFAKYKWPLLGLVAVGGFVWLKRR